MELFSEIKKTILFVTHSRDEVYHFCDRVCVLSSGHVETIRPKKDFFANPETIAAARLSGCRNFSRAERIFAHEIFAPDWGMKFCLQREIPDDLAYVGARAHYIEVIPLGTDASNCAVMQVDHLMEQQFESELILNCGDENNTQMCLLMDKDKALVLSRQEELSIRIPEAALLLLRE